MRISLPLITIIFTLIFGIDNPICLIAASTLFYIYFSKKSKGETILWKTSCSFVAIILIINILGYWGVPGTIVHIWFWSLPIFFIAAIFFYFFHKQNYIVFLLLLTCSLCIIFNEFRLISCNYEVTGVTQNEKEGGVGGIDGGLLANIADRWSLLPLRNAYDAISTGIVKKKWIISLAYTPTLNSEWLAKHACAGEYYVFGEHDNLTNFIGSNSPFNPDAFRRRSPWNTYKPVMNPRLFRATQKDVFYCSNIGCTLKKELISYPLLWSYTKYGVPILLAKGVIDNGRRFVFIGDSDPSGSFLAPFNPFWLRALLGIPSYINFSIAILMLILGFYTIKCKKSNKTFYILPILILLLLFVDKANQGIDVHTDVSLVSTGQWLTPHYQFHYSGLAKSLVLNDLSVSVQRRDTTSELHVELITKKNHLIGKSGKHKYAIRVVMLLPETSVITPSGKIISSGSIPLGKTVVDLGQQNKIIIEDSRNIYIDGIASEKGCYAFNDTYVIATGSPQKIEGLYGVVHKK